MTSLPESSVLGFSFQLSPCQPILLDVSLEVPAPGVLGPASFSCAFWVSSKGQPGDATIGFE